MSDVTVDDRDITLVVISFLALAATLALLVVNLVLLVDQNHSSSLQAQKADLVYNGLCSLDKNLKEQVQNSEHYLILHPDGAPALHISAASIQQSIDREKATITSLSSLNCQ